MPIVQHLCPQRHKHKGDLLTGSEHDVERARVGKDEPYVDSGSCDQQASDAEQGRPIEVSPEPGVEAHV